MVRRGESVSRIAVRHGVSRGALIAANGDLANPAVLRPGQRLAVPGCRAPVHQAVEVAGSSDAPAGTQHAAVELPSVNSQFLVARVGPRRVPTRMHLAVPEFNGNEIDFAWPVDGPVLSGFGRRRGGWHAGVDIRAERGTPIRPAAPGVVIFSGWETFYGKIVRIEHPNGFVTLYAHNLENLVQVGDYVDTDTVIATVGRTGRASADHVHFEIRRNGMAYNPTHLLEPRDSPVLVASPYAPPELDEIPVSALSPDDLEQP
jgi:murein DD-endopeptidase MepM/ murein hydrolase activator NlpD